MPVEYEKVVQSHIGLKAGSGCLLKQTREEYLKSHNHFWNNLNERIPVKKGLNLKKITDLKNYRTLSDAI